MLPKKNSIFGKNFIAFVIYTTVGYISLALQFNPIFLLPLVWIPHAVILILFAFIKLIQKNTKEAGEYFLTGFVILIIGFGVCAGILNSGMLDSMFKGL